MSYSEEIKINYTNTLKLAKCLFLNFFELHIDRGESHSMSIRRAFVDHSLIIRRAFAEHSLSIRFETDWPIHRSSIAADSEQNESRPLRSDLGLDLIGKR